MTQYRVTHICYIASYKKGKSSFIVSPKLGACTHNQERNGHTYWNHIKLCVYNYSVLVDWFIKHVQAHYGQTVLAKIQIVKLNQTHSSSPHVAWMEPRPSTTVCQIWATSRPYHGHMSAKSNPNKQTKWIITDPSLDHSLSLLFFIFLL